MCAQAKLLSGRKISHSARVCRMFMSGTLEDTQYCRKKELCCLLKFDFLFPLQIAFEPNAAREGSNN
jgi:hypothetical protein